MEETQTLDNNFQEEQQDPPKKYSVKDFATKIRQKYKAYNDVDDDKLVKSFIKKYPVYQDKIEFSQAPIVKKKEDIPSPSLVKPFPSAKEFAASIKPIRDNTVPLAQMNVAETKAKSEENFIQKESPVLKQKAKEERIQAAAKNVVVDDFNPEKFLQEDIEKDGIEAAAYAFVAKKNINKITGISGKNFDDAVSLKLYNEKRNEEIEKSIQSIRHKLQVLKDEKREYKRGDISQSYRPILDPKLAKQIEDDIPEDEKTLLTEIATLKDKQKKLFRAIDYFANKQVVKMFGLEDKKKLSQAKRFIMGDKSLEKQQRYEEKGIPVSDEEKLNDDLIGLSILNDDLEERKSKGIISEDEYHDAKYNIEEQSKYAINKYPELKSKRMGLLVAQELGGDAKDYILAASMGDEKALKAISEKTGLSKKDLSFIKYGDIPNETFIGNIAGRVTDAATGLTTGALRLINNVIGIDEDRLSYINEGINSVGRNVFGENTYEHTEAPTTLIGKDLQEYQNPNAGKYNYNAATIKNFAGNAIGGLLGFIGGTKGLGALGMGERAALWTNVIASEYEPNYQMASTVMGKDATEAQKNMYALGIGAIHAAAFEFIPHSAKQKLGFAKVEQNAAKEFKQILGTKSIKEVDRELLKGWVEKTIESIAKSSGEAAKVVAATKGGSVASHIVNAMVGEDEYQKQNFDELASEFEPNKIGEEVIGLALSLGLIGIPQGVKNSRQYKEGLYDAGLHPESYKTVLKQMVGDGRITEKEAEQRGEVIDVMANLQKSIPDINPSTNQRLTHSQKVEYAYNRAKEIALKAQKENVKDDVALSHFYDKNAKELVDERKSIIDGTHNEYLETVDLHQRILDTGKHNVALNAGTKTEGVQYLQEQALTTPNSVKNSLNGDVELTTDLIARNEPTGIKAEIKDLKEKHKKLIENEKKQDANEIQKHIELLEQGLEKTKKVEEPKVEETISKEVIKGEPENISQPIELSVESIEPILSKEQTSQEVNVEDKTFTKNALDRADAKKIYQQVREVDVATDAAQLALEYIANGGNVSEGVVNEIAGSVTRTSLNTGAKEKRSSEYNVRDYADKGNETLDGLAHRLWEANNQRIPETEIKDALMDAINSHSTRLDAAKTYLERYSAEYNEKQMQEKFYQEHLKEIEAEEKAINDFLNNEKELENEAFADENYVTKLIEKYESETKGEDKQPTSSTESSTNKGVSSETSNEKTKVNEEVEEDLQIQGGGKQPPKEPIKNDFLYSPNEQKRTSGLMRHLLEAKNVDESIKQGIKDKGLDKYEVANNAEAREVASQIVNSLGKNDALQVARMEDMHPSVRSAIYAEVIDNAFKLEQEAIKSGDKEAQMEAAAEWASVSKEYDKKLTAGGQFTAYAAHFYKQSPLGFVLKSNEQIAKKFEDYIKDKDTDLQEVFKLITETESGKDILNKKVEELRKEERKAERKKRDKKIDDFFDGLKAKGDILYSAPIPPSVWNGAMDVLKVATKGGDRVVDAVQKAIEHISKSIGDDWDKERFRKEYEQKISDIADGGVKEKSYNDLLKEKIEALQKRKKELEKSISKGGVAPAKKIDKFSDEAEVEKLEIDIKELQKENENLLKAKKEGKYSDEAKIEASEKAAKKNIEELEEKIANNDLDFDKIDKPTSPQLEAYREKQKQLRKQLEEKRKEAKVGKYSDEAKMQNEIDAKKERIFELKRRINEGDYSAEAYNEKVKKEKTDLDKELEETQKEYNEAKKKSPQYIEKKSKQYLDMVRGRLKNMNEKQKEDFIRRISKKLIENGALRYEEFKTELADVMGFKELTPEQIARAEELTKQINSLEDIENSMVEKKTVQSKLDYIEAQNKAAEAQNELFNMVARKTDLMSTFKSWYTGSLMGIQSLFVNTVFNPIQQLTVRMPKAVLLNIGEQGGKLISKAMHKLTGSPLYHPKLNILDAQKGYFGSFSPAIKNAWFNFKKGVENRDLFGKNEYQTSLSPRLAKEELNKFKRGEIYLTPMEVLDRKVRKSIFARQADFILRGMQFGDVIPRWMAEGAKSIQIAKNELGITDPVELDIFMYSPEKMAKQILLKQGKSEIQASKLAAEIKERIVFEGEKAVMQEGNLLKSISSATDRGLTINEKDELGMRAAKTVGSTLKTMTFPFIGIPANLAWQGFKLINPEISLGLSISQMSQSLYKAKKGDAAGAKKYFEMSKDNFAHSVLGLTYLSAASALVAAGLTRSSNDEKVSVKERTGESTYGKQNQFNMGKAMGGDDFWVDNKFLGLFGTMLDVKSKQKDEALKKGEKISEENDTTWVDDFSERIGYGGIAQLNNLIFNNGSKVVSAISGGDTPFRMWMAQTTNGLSSLFTGGTYTSFSKAILPEQVAVKGGGVVSEIINSQKQRNVLLRLGIDLFGGNGTPPSKISIWGEPIKNDRSVSGVLGNMLGWEKDSKDVFGAIIYDDYRRTGNTKFFPMPEDAKFSINGKQVELNKEQKIDLDILVGQARKTFVKAIVYDMTTQYGGKTYSQIEDDKEKVEFLNVAYDAAKKIGYKKFIEKYPQFDKIEKTEDEIGKEKETKNKNKNLSNELINSGDNGW